MARKAEDDDFLPATPEQTEYLRNQQDPYAKLSVTLRDSKSAALDSKSRAQPIRELTASKAHFVVECRRIFGFYVPEAEKGRLRGHHKSFIARNQSRSGSSRYKILVQLRKYDLSNIPGLSTQFNREAEDLTEAKLRRIEQLVDADE